MNKQIVDEMIFGSCLGDGGINKAVGKNKHAYISFTHNLKKETEYTEMKHKLISEYYKVGKLKINEKKNTIAFALSSNEFELTNWIKSNTRKDDNKRKLPVDKLHLITKIALLFWYLDDGSLTIGIQKRQGRKSSIYRKLRIALQSFKDEEIIATMNYINKEFDLSFKPFIEKGKIVSIGISNNIDEIIKFLKLFDDCQHLIPECLKYKFCLCYKKTKMNKKDYEIYNKCNFHETSICTCRNKDLTDI